MWNNNRKLIHILLLYALSFQYLMGYSWPIDVGQSSAPMTSPFGPRMYPYGYYDFHPGIDIRTQNSTTVVAAHDGFADWVGYNGSYHLMVFLGEASYDYATGYAHLADTVNLYYPLEVVISKGFQIAISGGSSVSSR